jgi:hypothetical protein
MALSSYAAKRLAHNRSASTKHERPTRAASLLGSSPMEQSAGPVPCRVLAGRLLDDDYARQCGGRECLAVPDRLTDPGDGQVYGC